MLKKIAWISLILTLAFVGYLYGQAAKSKTVAPIVATAATTLGAEELTTVAFGSCNRQYEDQSFWRTISRNSPDYWVWGGDNIYGDKLGIDGLVDALEAYAVDPDYDQFVSGLKEVHGIYDDHDYGLNDGGKNFPAKRQARQALRHFLGRPAFDLIDTTRSGSYYATSLGEGDRAVRLVVLDSRWNRDDFAPATKEGHRYGASPDGDILGEEQWDWLEEELQASTAAAHLIVSSIQVLPEDHAYEKWANFPRARTRLLDLLAATRPASLLLLSGDRHVAEISKVDHQGFTVYEMTSSGLTHSYEAADEPNRHRISDLIGVRNFAVLNYLTDETTGDPQLLATVRSIEDNEVLAEIAFGADGQIVPPTDLRARLAKSTTMAQQLQPCPNKPNCVSTQTDDPTKLREPIPYTGSLTAAQERLKRVVSGLKRTRLKSESEGYLHYTFKTWPIPFIDDVEFLFDDENKVIHYRSASRVGHSDLGANGKRMAKVVAAWNAAD